MTASKGLCALLLEFIPLSLNKFDGGEKIVYTPNDQILLRRYPVMINNKIEGILFASVLSVRTGGRFQFKNRYLVERYRAMRVKSTSGSISGMFPAKITPVQMRLSIDA
jgi:hypothetical protein